MNGRFTRMENLHLTLAFIGEYKDPNAVLDVMETITLEPFDLNLSGVGHFHDLFWVGVQPAPELDHYVKSLRRALAEHNIPYDRKKFSPHITLIRRAEFLDQTAVEVVRPPVASMFVENVSLMRSDRGKHGMIYTELGTA